MTRWAKSSRDHRVGHARAAHIMTTAPSQAIITKRGEDALLWVGLDQRGIELEVIAVITESDDLLVIHVMPTELRRKR